MTVKWSSDELTPSPQHRPWPDQTFQTRFHHRTNSNYSENYFMGALPECLYNTSIVYVRDRYTIGTLTSNEKHRDHCLKVIKCHQQLQHNNIAQSNSMLPK